jgi:hypothetical protein
MDARSDLLARVVAVPGIRVESVELDRRRSTCELALDEGEDLEQRQARRVHRRGIARRGGYSKSHRNSAAKTRLA